MSKKDLDDLRRDRKVAADQMSALAVALGELEGAETLDETAIAAKQGEFDAASAEFTRLDKTVKREEAVEQAKAQAASGSDEARGTNPSAPGAPGTMAAQAKNPDHEGIEVGFMVHALARARGDREKAMAMLDRDGFTGISAALAGTSDAAGGVTIPQAQAADLIGLLRPKVVVRASGARVVPLPAGQLRHARQTASATAGYGAEATAITASEPTFDAVQENFKKLTALVPVSNSLLRHTSIGMAALVRDDLVKSMALREDLAFLRGDGTANTPKGLRNWTLVANWLASIANDQASVEAALRKLVSLVEDANVAMVSPGWVMRANTKNFLSSLRNANGFFTFPSLQTSNLLLGHPVRVTSQIPDNLGAGGNEAEVYFADFNEVMIGDSLVITVDASQEAAFVDGGGSTISAYQNDLTLMRAISEHDLAPAHDEALAGLNGVSWFL